MTAKDKALEIMNKYYNLLNPNFPHINVLWKDCKQCSLISVNEIIYETQFEVPNIRQKYWLTVKQAIENL